MNLATIIVVLIIAAGVYWSVATLRRTGGRRCDGCCGGCSCDEAKTCPSKQKAVKATDQES
ncbi:MAG: FeoB-associated Cys-rich membrane protein [Bacteroidales bacterium]|nr:FeoB-associated Cys-rich membrane protein [Bacteroidales bacterium]